MCYAQHRTYYALSIRPERQERGDRHVTRHQMFGELSWHRAEHLVVKCHNVSGSMCCVLVGCPFLEFLVSVRTQTSSCTYCKHRGDCVACLLIVFIPIGGKRGGGSWAWWVGCLAIQSLFFGWEKVQTASPGSVTASQVYRMDDKSLNDVLLTLKNDLSGLPGAEYPDLQIASFLQLASYGVCQLMHWQREMKVACCESSPMLWTLWTFAASRGVVLTEILFLVGQVGKAERERERGERERERRERGLCWSLQCDHHTTTNKIAVLYTATDSVPSRLPDETFESCEHNKILLRHT